MNQPESELDPVLEFDRQPPVAYVETDRFCDGCGYNLRTQSVRRDVRTKLLLCRCPECGCFQATRDQATAGRVWLQRLGTLLLFGWIMVVLGAGFGLGAAQVGLTLIPLEELTTYRQVALSNPASTQPSSSTTTTFQSGSTVTVISGQRLAISSGGRTTTWRRQVRESFEHYTAFVVLVRGLSFALGFMLAMLAAVVFHHWRRWGYLVPVTAVSVAAGILVWYIWGTDHAHLREWANPHIINQGLAHFAGGLTGILLGRPFARLIVTLVLPPRIRQVLAFLWLADGKQPPAVAAGR